MYMLWVNFILGLSFVTLFFGGGGDGGRYNNVLVVMYDNEYKTKGSKI